MTNLNKILPLSLLAMLALSACSNPQAKSPTPDQIMVPVVNEEKVAVTEEANPMEETRKSMFASGYSCNDLKDTLGRQNCEMQVADTIGNMLQREITDSYDVKRCKELPAQLADSCEQRLKATGVQGPVSNEEVVMFDEAVRGMMPEFLGGEEPTNIYPTYDKTKCAELKTPGYKEYCENQIENRMDQGLLNEIFQSGKSSRCNELTLENNKFTCEQFFGITVEPVVEEPVITEPVITEPVITEPVITEPVITEPVITEPVITEPVITEPVVPPVVETIEETNNVVQ